ncbi:DUF397 domain-containing protein [Streptomyces sp. NBC_01373]|uniref:DUF397 domain-containing protein n=1 Tax=unclassified Streptomyces TaxID=2593676 RepID=UPI00225B0CDB|nr:DUF397 domain-containing protein [Streptomyces sp. NBC_01373]MCX4700733.1 DUF397 domain-containing protein [Streptomyces sp. NBC_01373]
METPDNWRKSSYSGPGDGDSCVEIADNLTRVAIRDSKDPSRGTLLFPAEAFAAFVEALKPDSAV